MLVVLIIVVIVGGGKFVDLLVLMVELIYYVGRLGVEDKERE